MAGCGSCRSADHNICGQSETPAPGANCYCDDTCTAFGDCCADYSTACTDTDAGVSDPICDPSQPASSCSSEHTYCATTEGVSQCEHLSQLYNRAVANVGELAIRLGVSSDDVLGDPGAADVDALLVDGELYGFEVILPYSERLFSVWFYKDGRTPISDGVWRLIPESQSDRIGDVSVAPGTLNLMLSGGNTARMQTVFEELQREPVPSLSPLSSPASYQWIGSDILLVGAAPFNEVTAREELLARFDDLDVSYNGHFFAHAGSTRIIPIARSLLPEFVE